MREASFAATLHLLRDCVGSGVFPLTMVTVKAEPTPYRRGERLPVLLLGASNDPLLREPQLHG